MRMYLFIDKELVRTLAPKIHNINFDIDFYEYSEKKSYTTNNSGSISPEFENNTEFESEKCESKNKNKVNLSGNIGTIYNYEITKRYINIEDVSTIKNNNFYYNIIEQINEDDRIKNIKGKVTKISEDEILLDKYTIILPVDKLKWLNKVIDHEIELTCLGYRISSLNLEYGTYRCVAMYIE